MKALILAGGKGTRLEPFTISLPKPLMPVGKYPILEILIRNLKKAGVTEIILAVGHLETLIRAYFNDGSKWGVKISYSSEDEPLGTAGPILLVKEQLKQPFFFMNGDIYSDINFNELYHYHLKMKSSATICLTKRHVDIDFGVIKTNDNCEFEEWQEKPKIEYLVSTGIYILNPRVIDYIPNGFYNIPDLIINLKLNNQKVTTLVHNGMWLDIGRIEDYQTACKLEEKKSIV